jgi:hypothetical protein
VSGSVADEDVHAKVPRGVRRVGIVAQVLASSTGTGCRRKKKNVSVMEREARAHYCRFASPVASLLQGFISETVAMCGVGSIANMDLCEARVRRAGVYAITGRLRNDQRAPAQPLPVFSILTLAALVDFTAHIIVR